MSIELSVVIPTLNREESLCATIEHFVSRETYDRFEVIVIDQTASHSAETERYLASAASRIRLVRVDYRSLPRARNHGVRLAAGEVVVFVDDDVIPTDGFLAAHAAAYADPTIGGVTGPAVSPGAALVPMDRVPAEFWSALERRGAMRFDLDVAFDARWAVGCNMSFRRESILAVGGFDERFFDVATGEDAEFSHRLIQTGARIRYEPCAALVHLQQPSGGCKSTAAVDRRMMNATANIVYQHSRQRPMPRHFWPTLARHFRRDVLTRRRLATGAIVPGAWWFARGVAKGLVLGRKASVLPLLRASDVDAS
ncbi:MAG: glycosyl transferase family 2 [Gemmatimonadetes bacterium]|nr:glycosyl transferase family 2 [Gemmatimonadota bacterium]